MSLRPAPESPIKVIRNIMLSVQLGYMHVYVHFDLVDNLSMLLLVGTSFTDRLVKGSFSMVRRSFPSSLTQLQLLRICATGDSAVYVTERPGRQNEYRKLIRQLQ